MTLCIQLSAFGAKPGPPSSTYLQCQLRNHSSCLSGDTNLNNCHFVVTVARASYRNCCVPPRVPVESLRHCSYELLFVQLHVSLFCTVCTSFAILILLALFILLSTSLVKFIRKLLLYTCYSFSILKIYVFLYRNMERLL